jgi:UDP-glucose 4-epimerase
VILRAAANKKKPVVMASTSEIYGKSVCTPFREDTDIVMGPTTKIRWSYACSKALDEFLGLAYWREKQVPVTIARLFNTVGPRQTGRYGMVIPKLVCQALRGEPITVYGSGEQTRCFAYVGEVVECLVRIGTLGTLAGEVINIGNDQEVCMNQVATLVKGITRSSSEIVHIPYDVAYSPGFEDMSRRVPCLEKAERPPDFASKTARRSRRPPFSIQTKSKKSFQCKRSDIFQKTPNRTVARTCVRSKPEMEFYWIFSIRSTIRRRLPRVPT